MCGIGGLLSGIVVLLGWALLTLVRPDWFRESWFPAPDWVTDPARLRLRRILTVVVAVLFVVFAAPLAIAFYYMFRAEPRLVPIMAGATIAGASLAHEEKPGTREIIPDWLPVRGKWRRLFLFLVGLLLLGVGFWMPRFG